MQNSYSVYRKIIAYFVTVLLVFHLFSGNIGYQWVWAEENPTSANTVKLESSAGEGSIPQQEVTVTYVAESIASGESAYRKVTKEDDAGNPVVVWEGMITLEAAEDGSGLQATELYSGVADENAEGVWVVEDGVYTVTYYLKDANDSAASDMLTVSFTIDSSAPEVVFGCEDADGFDSEEIVCKAKVSDADFDNCDIGVHVSKTSMDGTVEDTKLEDEIFENGVEKELTFTEEGMYQVYMEVTDRAGNTGTTEEVRFVIDKTKPVITIDAGGKADGGVYNTKENVVTLSVVVEDFSLVKDSCNVTVMRDGTVVKDITYQWLEYTYKRTTTLVFDDTVEDGKYTVQVSAEDMLQQSSAKEFTFYVDTTVIDIEDLKVSYASEMLEKPTAVEQDGVTVYHLKDSARVSAYAVEKNYSGAKAYVNTERDGTSIDTKTVEMSQEREEIVLSYADEGSYSTSIYGEDSFGNESDVQTIRFVIDKTVPEMSISQVVDGVEQDIAENQLFSVNDNRTLRFEVDEQYHNRDSYQIRVERKTDGSVNPMVTVLEASDIEWKDGDETDVLYYENRDLFLEEGQYAVTISGKDLAGNQAVAKTVTFYIDSTAPVITQRSAVIDGKVYDGAVKFQYDIKEFNYADVTAQITVLRTLDGTTYETKQSLRMSKMYTSFEYLCEEQGEYRITVTATDQAGNEAAQSPSTKGYTIQFVVDKTAPELFITGVTNRQMSKEPVTLIFGATDRNHNFGAYKIQITRSDVDGEIETVEISGNNASSYDVKSGWNAAGYTTAGQNQYKTLRTLYFSKEGSYRVTFSGEDKAGNASRSTAIQFSVDKSAPVISGVTYSNADGLLTEKYHNIYSNKAILVEFMVTDQVVGVDDQKVYITVGESADRTTSTKFYIAHKSIGNNYYVYIPTDLKVSEFDNTITIWANDKLGNESHVVSANIIYRTAKPSISMDCDADYSKWTNRDVTFHTTITDTISGLKEVVYKVDGKIVKKVTFKKLTYSYEYDVVASEDASKVTGYTVTVEATNNSGTKQTAKRQVYIDKTKPTVKLSGVENGTHYRTNQVITTDVNDVSYKDTRTVYYITRMLDGKTNRMSAAVFLSTGYKDNCTRKMIREGQYTVYAITTDSAGNKRKSNTLSFVIDKTAPEVKVSGVTEGAMSGSAVTLEFECEESFFATNEVSIEVEKELDGETTVSEITGFPNNAKRTSLQKTFSEDGTYRVTISAVDKAGNVAASQSLSFSVDTTQPELRITGTDNYQMWEKPASVQFTVEESYYADNSVTITGTRRDVDGNVETIELPKMANTGKVSSLVQLFSEDGIYEFEIVAKDKAGNENSKNIHFTIDQSLPEIKGIAQYNGGYYQSFQMADSMEAVFKDLTVVSYRMLLNGVEYNGTDTIKQEGKYHLYVEVEDELGHQNIQNVEFIVDHTPPKVIFTGVKDGEMVKEAGTISLTLVNAEDVITGIRMNGVEYETDTRNLAYSEYGSYRIEVDCEDKAGNAVTRELYFIYSNPMTIAFVTVEMGVLAIGMCIWLWVRTRKKEKEEQKL